MPPPLINQQTIDLLDISPTPVFIMKWGNGTVLYANLAARMLLGDCLGKGPAKIFAEPSASEALTARISSDGNAADFETELLLPGDGATPVRLASTPVLYNDEPAIHCLIIDLAKQKQLETGRAEWEAQYRRLADNSSDVAWETGLDLKLTNLSQSTRTILGYEPSALIGTSFLSMFTKTSAEYAEARIKDRLAEEESGKRTQGRLLEMEMRHSSGRIINSDVTMNPVRSEDGTLVGLHGIIRDVSDRARIEERIKQSERHYRELVEQTNSFILRWKRDGTITFANTYACEFFGFLPEELVGKHMIGTIVPDSESSGQDLRELVKRIGENPEDFRTAEYQNMRWDRSRVWISWANSPAYDENGQLYEILSIGHDVSERRQREQQLAYLTVYDPMSGLYNRAYFDTEIERLYRGRKFPVSVVIASLDNLHQTNDIDGREAGDLLLMKTARLLRESVRSEDIVARTGGDGFAIILPDMEEQQTAAFLMRLRADIITASAEEPEVLLSVGAATAHKSSELHMAQRNASIGMAADKSLRRKGHTQ